MAYEEVVIGFDTRVSLDEAREGWTDEERRHQYLLRPEVDVPLSVDEAVWPRRGATARGELEVLTPRYASLEDALQHAAPDEEVVAITVWRGPGEPELPAGPAWPMKVDPDWTLLGWDVCDGVFPSATSNCGYFPDEVLDWRARWADRFNEVHLFADLPTAFAFRDASNKRVPEHAPFGVLGLYRVRGAASGSRR